MNVYSPTIGIILGILACIPGIGVIDLLAFSGQATWIMQQNGIKVGLFGVDANSISGP